MRTSVGALRCILSKFYIKPQLPLPLVTQLGVVSYRNSTSNHNFAFPTNLRYRLYLIEILHQTTTPQRDVLLLLSCILSKFYIKPQLPWPSPARPQRCILSKFYIKPQLEDPPQYVSRVVSYRNSTSNHNSQSYYFREPGVVSYRNSTSNHNRDRDAGNLELRCILSKFYIKPQLVGYAKTEMNRCILSKFYIKPQLDNTTFNAVLGCILSKFYIKPQPRSPSITS